jgi:hypothetical protein
VLPPTAIPAAVRQLAAVAAVGAIGTLALAGAQSAASGGLSPSAASAVAPSIPGSNPARAAAGDRVASTPAPRARHAATPAKHPTSAASHSAARPRARWLPSGTGMWIYEWDKSDGGNAASVVARARRAGLTHLFVRTGSSHDGYTGTEVLKTLLPATAHTGVRIVAWDFPELKHPYGDAYRLARAAWAGWNTSVPHVAAVAPDIETPAEGTHTSALRVTEYLTELRKLLPADVAILTTVPWPSKERVGIYPYAAVAARSDAILPMAYWYDNSPREVTATSMAFLRRYHRPVQPVGQGYDGKLDVPWLKHNHLGREVPAFFATAHAMGAKAVSLWSWQAAPPIAWRWLYYAHRWFPPSAPKK